MLIFNRALTAQEIAAIHAVRLPIHPPSDEEVAAAAKAKPLAPPAPAGAAPAQPIAGGVPQIGGPQMGGPKTALPGGGSVPFTGAVWAAR